MGIRAYKVAVTTAVGGAATAYTPKMVGELLRVEYEKTDFADGVDFTITNEGNGESCWTQENVNASAMRLVRRVVDIPAGTSDSVTGVKAPIPFANERAKIVIADGGDEKTGLFRFVVRE